MITSFWNDLVILFYEVFKIFTLYIFIFILRFLSYFSQIFSVEERLLLLVKKCNLFFTVGEYCNFFQAEL